MSSDDTGELMTDDAALRLLLTRVEGQGWDGAAGTALLALPEEHATR